MTKKVLIYTDGACRGNPGPGGWGALLIYDGHRRMLYGGELNTTNNRMELLAAIEALAALKRPCEVELTTDSQYLRNGMTVWLDKWKRNGWRSSQNQTIKNKDLWERLDYEASQHHINWHWIKGHSNHPENEMVDQLANRGIDELLRK